MSHDIEDILAQLRELAAESEPEDSDELAEEGEGEEDGEDNFDDVTPSIEAVRDLAKSLGQDQALADELWASEMTEAKWLAACIADPAAQNQKSLQTLAKSVDDVELAELIANLIAQTEVRLEIIQKFVGSKDLFTKVIGFTAIASTVLDDPDQRTEVMEEWLTKIAEGAEDEREEVSNAVMAALLEIGKVDQYWNDAAIVLACELQAESQVAAALGTEAEETLTRMGTVVDRRAAAGNSKNARNQNKRRNNNNNNKSNRNNNNRRGRGQQGQNTSGAADGKKPARRNGRNKRRSRTTAPKPV